MAYVDRPTPSRGGAWAHSTLGAVVHNALRAVFELPPERRTPEQAVLLLRRYWKSDGFAGAEQAAEYRRRAEGWIGDYLDRIGGDRTVIAVERWVSAPVGTLLAEGRVDRIDQHGGELVVVDYKTGRHALSIDDARDSRALALYALASRRMLRRPCTRVELHHLPSGRVLGFDHTENSLLRHLERAEQLAGELRAATEASEAGADADTVFPPHTGRHCSWCDFRAHCPEGRRAAEGLAPWALLGE